ncbi:MAG: methyltransferase [Acidimicrobiales bacterium]|nr:methyltransferase [Acidimicrobiales bacterium]
MNTISSPLDLIQLLVGYQPAATISTASRLGLFDALTDQPQPASEIAKYLAVDDSNLEALLRALVQLGLVSHSDGEFAATPFSANYLQNNSDLDMIIRKEAFFSTAWSRLDEVVRSGHPILPPWKERLHARSSQATEFLYALDALARLTGPPLAELPELTRGRILDVGGGLGTYSRALAEAGSTTVLVDLPDVIELARDHLADLPAGSVEFVAADIFSESACGIEIGSVDAALVSHMLHDYPKETGVELLRSANRAIRPGGFVVVNDFANDTGPAAFGGLFDLMMRVETGGAAHSLATLGEMLLTSGFCDVRRVAFPDPITVLIATKDS